MKKNQGLTLIETLIAVTVTTSLIMMTVYWLLERNRHEKAVSYGQDIVTIVTAFDKRIHVDGFDSNNFKNGKAWANSASFLSMLSTEFIAKDANCGKTNGWVPALATEKTSQLLSCNLWTQIPYGMNATATITVDTTGYVKNFITSYRFQNIAQFNDSFKYLNLMKLTASSSDSLNITGGHSYYFANASDLNTKISTAQCITLKTSCALVAAYDREGGYEYLRVDGTNSMLGTPVTFRESKASSKQQCIKWFRSAAGAWTSSPVDCGIGIYTKTGYPISVDVAAENSTQQRVLLDRSCNVYATSGNLVDTTTTSPCGVLPIGTGATPAIYQVVDTASAKTGFIQTLYTSSLVSNKVNTQFAEIAKDLTVNGKTYLNDTLTVNAIANISKTLNVGGDIIGSSSLTIAGNAAIRGSLGVNGTINAGQSITASTGNITANTGNINAPQGSVNAVNGNFSNNINTSTLTATSTANFSGTTNMNGRLNVNEYLTINRTVTANSYCATIGMVARNTQGQLMTCQANTWKRQYSPTYIQTNKYSIDNAPGSAPGQNCLQQAGGISTSVNYWLSCGSRYCIVNGYTGGLLQELSCESPSCGATALCF